MILDELTSALDKIDSVIYLKGDRKMDLVRMLLSIIGIVVCVAKYIKNKKSIYVFWITLFIYSLTSLTFVIRPEEHQELIKILEYPFMKGLNTILLISSIVVLFYSLRVKYKKAK